MVFVSRKRRTRCQIIYVINQDRKDVVYVIVIFTLMKIRVHVAVRDLGPNPEINDYGKDDNLLWAVFLEAIISGT